MHSSSSFVFFSGLSSGRSWSSDVVALMGSFTPLVRIPTWQCIPQGPICHEALGCARILGYGWVYYCVALYLSLQISPLQDIFNISKSFPRYCPRVLCLDNKLQPCLGGVDNILKRCCIAGASGHLFLPHPVLAMVSLNWFELSTARGAARV